MAAAVVTIRVVQSDGCGFEVTQAADERALPMALPRREVARLLLAATGRALRQLEPEVLVEVGTLRDLLRQFGVADGEP